MRIGLCLGMLGEVKLILGIWEAEAEYFQGAEDFFHGFGETGSKDPLGPQQIHTRLKGAEKTV